MGRAVSASDILRHEAMLGETRTLLWQALTAKAWYGIRSDLGRDPRWRDLIPRNRRKWQTQAQKTRHYDFLEIGYWLREQQLHDAGEVFGWKFNNARELFVRSALRSIKLRQAVLYWLRRQSPDLRDRLAKASRGKIGFEMIPKALQKRFPASGPGSALLPQHYTEAELRQIVGDVLDAAIAEDPSFGFASSGLKRSLARRWRILSGHACPTENFFRTRARRRTMKRRVN